MASRPQYPPPPPDVQEDVLGRAVGLCEWCGMESKAPMNFHHRYYTGERDIPEQLMSVHRECHSIIHFGGSVLATTDSMARSGDRGKGQTPQWRAYLKNKGKQNRMKRFTDTDK